jgi:hypothetical protein
MARRPGPEIGVFVSPLQADTGRSSSQRIMVSSFHILSHLSFRIFLQFDDICSMKLNSIVIKCPSDEKRCMVWDYKNILHIL